MDLSFNESPYLAPDITEQEVEQEMGVNTIWVEGCAGRLFEQHQGARIKGCLPGNFPIIDATGQVTSHNGNQYNAVSSLKTIDLSAPVFNDSGAWQHFHNKVGKHIGELGTFRVAKGNLSTGNEVKEVEVSIDDYEIMELRIGVQESIYNNFLNQMTIAAKSTTDNSIGGTNQVCTSVFGGVKARKIPILTRIIPIPDNYFQDNSGSNYEKVKKADIHGFPPAQFKTIDKFSKTKERVISYKTHDILNCYPNPKVLKTVLKNEVDALVEFSSYTEPNGLTRTIRREDFKDKRLSVAIPFVDTKTLKQFHPIFLEMYNYAQKNGVKLRIHKVA